MFDSECRVEYHKVSEYEATDQGLPYDFESIMHYASDDFSSNGKPTFVPRKRFLRPIGTADNASYYDYFHINLLYCQGTLTSDGKEVTLFIYILLYTTSRKGY